MVNAPAPRSSLATGPWRAAGALLVDLPGAYSLLARTPDEQVTADAVAGTGPLGTLDLVVVLADASALARSLYLVGQVARAGMPVLVGLTMRDVAAARGVDVDPEALATALGVPVVGLDPRTGAGVDALVGAVRSALDGPPVRLVVRPGASAAAGPGATGPDDLALDDDLDPRLAEAAEPVRVGRAGARSARAVGRLGSRRRRHAARRGGRHRPHVVGPGRRLAAAALGRRAGAARGDVGPVPAWPPRRPRR